MLRCCSISRLRVCVAIFGLAWLGSVLVIMRKHAAHDAVHDTVHHMSRRIGPRGARRAMGGSVLETERQKQKRLADQMPPLPAWHVQDAEDSDDVELPPARHIDEVLSSALLLAARNAAAEVRRANALLVSLELLTGPGPGLGQDAQKDPETHEGAALEILRRQQHVLGGALAEVQGQMQHAVAASFWTTTASSSSFVLEEDAEPHEEQLVPTWPNVTVDMLRNQLRVVHETAQVHARAVEEAIRRMSTRNSRLASQTKKQSAGSRFNPEKDVTVVLHTRRRRLPQLNARGTGTSSWEGCARGLAAHAAALWVLHTVRRVREIHPRIRILVAGQHVWVPELTEAEDDYASAGPETTHAHAARGQLEYFGDVPLAVLIAAVRSRFVAVLSDPSLLPSLTTFSSSVVSSFSSSATVAAAQAMAAHAIAADYLSLGKDTLRDAAGQLVSAKADVVGFAIHDVTGTPLHHGHRRSEKVQHQHRRSKDDDTQAQYRVRALHECTVLQVRDWVLTLTTAGAADKARHDGGGGAAAGSEDDTEDGEGPAPVQVEDISGLLPSACDMVGRSFFAYAHALRADSGVRRSLAQRTLPLEGENWETGEERKMLMQEVGISAEGRANSAAAAEQDATKAKQFGSSWWFAQLRRMPGIADSLDATAEQIDFALCGMRANPRLRLRASTTAVLRRERLPLPNCYHEQNSSFGDRGKKKGDKKLGHELARLLAQRVRRAMLRIATPHDVREIADLRSTVSAATGKKREAPSPLGASSIANVNGHLRASRVDVGCTRHTKRCKADYIARNLPMPPCCRRHLADVLHYTDELLTKHKIAHWIDYSSLLAVARHGGKIVPWDYDSDMGIMGSSFEDLLALREEVSRDGYYLHHEKGSGDQGFARIFYSPRNAAYVDIYAFRIGRDGFVYNSCIGFDEGKGALPLKYLDPLELVEIEGKQVAAPNHVAEVAEWRYPGFRTTLIKKIFEGWYEPAHFPRVDEWPPPVPAVEEGWLS